MCPLHETRLNKDEAASLRVNARVYAHSSKQGENTTQPAKVYQLYVTNIITVKKASMLNEKSPSPAHTHSIPNLIYCIASSLNVKKKKRDQSLMSRYHGPKEQTS